MADKKERSPNEIPKGLGVVTDLLKRFSKAQDNYNLTRSLHQDAAEYSAPQRETFSMHSKGQAKNTHIFDSTAITGTEQFANRIQSGLMPSWMNWMNLVPGDEIPDEDRAAVKKELERVTKTFFTHLNHSNFYTELPPALTDLAIGTGALLIEEGAFDRQEPLLKFTNVPLSELYPETPPGGKLESIWRKHEMEIRHVLRTWPDAVLTEKLQDQLDKKPCSKITILNGMLFNPEDRMYWNVIMHEGSKHVLFTQDFKTQRLVGFRWHVIPGETYGRGPIISILPDIKTVNKVKEFGLRHAAIQIAGMYTGVNDGIFNPHTVTIAPGTIIPVGSNASANPSLTAITPSGDPGLSSFIIADLQASINRALFAQPLGEITDPTKTATEVIIRNQEMLKNSGASLGRLKTELVEQVVAACIDILRGRGKVADIVVDGREITIKQESPLAKAEDLEDFQNSQVWFSNVSQLPEAVLIGSVKVEELPGYWAEKLGVPEKLIRSENERKQLAAALQQVEPQGAPANGQ